MEILFCLVFTVELVMRLKVYRKTYFQMSDWKFNIFDCVLVFAQLIELLLEAIRSSQIISVNLTFMRTLRIIRLIRILRTARVMHLASGIRTLVSSISASLRSLAWTICLLTLMLYTLSVGLTSMVADVPDSASTEALDLYYGSIGTSALTLFQAITGGLDWRDPLVPLMDGIGTSMAALYTLYIAFSIIALMNTITGVFIETALSSAKEDHEQYMVNSLIELFKESAGGYDGSLTFNCFEKQMTNPQMREFFKFIDVDPCEARSVFKLLDIDDSDSLDASEFLAGCLRLRGPAKSLDMALLVRELLDLTRWFEARTERFEEIIGEGHLQGGGRRNSLDDLQFADPDIGGGKAPQPEERQVLRLAGQYALDNRSLKELPTEM